MNKLNKTESISFEDEVKLLKYIRELYKESLTKKKRLYTYITKAVFRSATDDKKVKYVSKAALLEAKKRGIDLSKMTWTNQTKVDKKRKVFHYEHCNPIKELREAVLNTSENINEIIKKDITCWILKKENRVLDKKYKAKRPNGWKKCYAKCKIEVFNNK